MFKQHDAATLAVSDDAGREPDADSLVSRLLAAYRATGTLPPVGGGDHEGDGDDGDDSDDGDKNGKPTSQGEGGISAEAAKKLRNENRNIRRRLREAERKLDEATSDESDTASDLQAKLDAAEQARADAERKLRDSENRASITESATRAGAISGSAVFGLIRDTLEYDDTGKPKNLDDAMKALRESEPALFRSAGRANGGSGGGDSRPDADKADPGYARILAAYESAGDE